jgi:hypothetical protein
MGKPEQNMTLFTYDGKGVVTIEAGVYNFFARAEGYHPEKKTVTISNDVKSHNIIFLLDEGPDTQP